jgi:hypothetical protein
VTPPVVDPAIQFSTGGTTLTFVVAANSTAVPPIQLQAGTVAGTIVVTPVLTAGGANVTPATLLPVTIVVPAVVPSITAATLTRSGNQLTVVMDGFSNTREMVQATFHFTGANGAAIDTPDITLPVATLFSGWFGSAPSDPYGSMFSYTQIFNISDGASNIGSVQITLTNGVGDSVVLTTQ